VLALYLDHMDVITRRVSEEKLPEFLHKSILVALTSLDTPLLERTLKIVPYALKPMGKGVVDTQLMPALTKLLLMVDKPHIAAGMVGVIITGVGCGSPLLIVPMICPPSWRHGRPSTGRSCSIRRRIFSLIVVLIFLVS